MLREGKAREKDGDLKAWREMIRHYLAAVTFADRCVGRLLDGLDRSPHRDNTVVVLWSDHGWDLGVKFRAGKAALWESTANCVLIIRDPQTPAAVRGTPSYARVGLQDLYPTIAARAGATKPAYVAGRDLTPLLRDPKGAWDEVPITTQGARNHALRDANFRYIRYADDPANAELYDQQADPREHTNRIADPALQAVRQAMNQQLDQRIAAGPFAYDTGKPGGAASDNEDSAAKARTARTKKAAK
jgi:arylsulfatase A-like enzyme